MYIRPESRRAAGTCHGLVAPGGRAYSGGPIRPENLMASAPPALLVTGPPADRTALRDGLEPHGFRVEQRAPAGLPADLAGYAALVLDGRAASADVLALCQR